jgi:TolB-like protein
MPSVWAELKRRNVVKVAVAYAIVGWLLVEVASTVLPTFEAPQWLLQAFTLFIVLGFPLALIFAWAFELTPEGIKREKDVDRSASITHKTGRKLDFLIIAVLGMAVAYFVVDKFFWVEKESTITPAVTEQSVAVLPFVDMSPNKDQEYFSDGIAEELLNQLSKIRGLQVPGRTSTFAFKGQNEDFRVIGEQLHVAHVLEGSIRKAGERVRITVQLVKAADGFHLWSETYDRDLIDIFAIQEEIAKAVAKALSITLGVGEGNLG